MFCTAKQSHAEELSILTIFMNPKVEINSQLIYYP